MEETIGERLKRLRIERGWSTYEVAKRLQVVPWNVSRLERASSLGKITAASLKRLAHLYGVSLDYLAREVDDPELEAASAVWE